MKTHQLLVAMLCASLPLLNGCSDSDNTIPEPAPEAQPTLKLSVACVGNGVTRSRAVTDVSHEYSLENENAINNALVLIYDKPLNSSDADAADGKVKAYVYLNDLGTPTVNKTDQNNTLTAQYYNAGGNAQTAGTYIIANEYGDSNGLEGIIYPEGALNKDTDYYAIALANVGNMGTTFLNQSVAFLRDYEYTGALCLPNDATKEEQPYLRNDWHTFVMSGVNEVKFTYSPDEETNIMSLGNTNKLMVQRLAARVDVAFGDQAIYQNGTTLDDWVKHPNLTLSEAEEDGSDVNGSDIIGIYPDNYSGTKSKYYPKKYDVEQLNDGSYLFPIYDYDYYLAHHTETNYKDVRITGALFKLWGIKIGNRVPVTGSKTLLFLQAKIGTNRVYLANEGAFTSNGNNTYSTNFIYSADNGANIDDATITAQNGANGLYTPNTVISNNLFVYAKGWPGTKGTWENADVWPFAFYSIIDYIGEHTYETDDTDETDATGNKYTNLKLSGMCNLSNLSTRTSAPSSADDDDDSKKYHNPECKVPVEVTFNLRHSFGPGETADGSKNLCYAVVRNTIYRIYFRFYSQGDNLVVRWYYRDGSDDEVSYDTTFSENILESNGKVND